MRPRNSLPKLQAQGVTVKKVSTNILMFVSLFSDDDRYDGTYLSNYATINLVNPIARLPGMGQVKVLGAGSYSMRIWLDANKMQSFGLTTVDVVNAIKAQNAQVAAGQLGGPPVQSDQLFQFTLTTLGRLSDAKQFENIIIKIGVRSAERRRPDRSRQGRGAGRAEPADIFELWRPERQGRCPHQHLRAAGCQCPERGQLGPEQPWRR